MGNKSCGARDTTYVLILIKWVYLFRANTFNSVIRIKIRLSTNATKKYNVSFFSDNSLVRPSLMPRNMTVFLLKQEHK